MKKILYVVGFFGALALFLGNNVYALKVSPALIETKAKSSEIFTRTVQITNDTSEELFIAPELVEAEGSEGEGGVAKYSKPTETSTLANWITFEGDTQITLAPSEMKKVSFIITVPDNAPAGGHYAAINWTIKGTPSASGASLQGGVATNIALDVAGQVVEKGDVVSFLTEGDVKKYDKLPVTFITRINNGGSRHFKPKGNVVIKDMFGKEVANLPFNVTNSGGNILPGSTREFKNTWENGFAFGKYTATADLMLGGAGKKMATYEFWVMPAGLAILWVIILVVVLLILGLLIKNMMIAMKKK